MAEMEKNTNKDKGKQKSVKTIYDGNTGFPIMVNLYVIKYIYYHIDKASRFIDAEEGRRKAYPIYGTRMLPVSRQRLDRINKGSKFEFTRAEADSIIEVYGIDMKYFRKDDPVAFQIDGIDEVAWKCFYNDRYYGKYALPTNLAKDGKKMEEKAGEVESALKKLVENWENALQKDSPLFAICYYCHYGERYDKPNILSILKECLEELDYREWDNQQQPFLEEMRKLLKAHIDYIQSFVYIKKLLSQQQKQREKK